MPKTLQDVIAACDQLWPEKTAEPWDKVGLVCGVPSEEVVKVVLAVDASLESAQIAADENAQLLITHHPLLLRGVHSVAATDYKGQVLTGLIRSQIALYAAHTNADIVTDGVSDIIAKRLGIVDPQPLEASAHNPAHGIGRYGKLPEPLTLLEFARQAAAIFPPTISGLRVAGNEQRLVQNIALCGGAGDSLLDNEHVRNADVYLTSDLRHHPVQEFTALPSSTALIDVEHAAAESLWLEVAAAQLRELLPGIEFKVIDSGTSPWNFSVGATNKLS